MSDVAGGTNLHWSAPAGPSPVLPLAFVLCTAAASCQLLLLLLLLLPADLDPIEVHRDPLRLPVRGVVIYLLMTPASKGRIRLLG
jgi:hypothetical protein